MSNRRGKSKIKISGSKPEPPAFLQRIREQLVADEDADRREQSEKKRKSRPTRSIDPDEAPELVRVGDDDITQEEFERMKAELETQYRLDNKKARMTEDLDMDYLIKNRANKRMLKAPGNTKTQDRHGESIRKPEIAASSKGNMKSDKLSISNKKTLNYDSSSSEGD